MADSGRKINYQVRPAKNIERKLIKDSILKLAPYCPSNEYRYVGFGSKYFADFNIMHRYLHIDDMISIEAGVNKKRYEFNKPFQCIKMDFGHSNDRLPRISFDKKIIAWLDNDGIFQQSIVNDVATFIKKAQTGSIFIVSYNSSPYDLELLKRKYDTKETKGLRIRHLKQLLDSEKYCVPSAISDREISKWEYFSKIQKQTISNQVKNCLNERNSQCQDDPWLFKQFLYLDYKDDAQMSTFGGVLYRSSEQDRIDQCRLEQMEFARTEDERCLIEVPNLTLKELRTLLEKMPIDLQSIPTPDVGRAIPTLPEEVFPDSDVRKFIKYYKYFPVFQELEYV